MKKVNIYDSHNAAWIDYDLNHLKVDEIFSVNGILHKIVIDGIEIKMIQLVDDFKFDYPIQERIKL